MSELIPDTSTPETVSKLEQRMWTIVIGIALAFGGIWLQNQYSTVIKLQEQLQQYMQFVDDKYVEESTFQTHSRGLDGRLDRIENKLDDLSERMKIDVPGRIGP